MTEPLLSERIAYQFPGIGKVEFFAFPYARRVRSWAQKNNYTIRLEFSSQLGYLRQSRLGSQHTRLDYVMAQWAIISTACRRRAITDLMDGSALGMPRRSTGNGLGSGVSSLPKMHGHDKHPSGAEVLQCLALLANLAHVPQSFAASRAWLETLRNNKQVRNTFLGGFSNRKLEAFQLTDRESARAAIDAFDVYGIHHFNTLFLLSRARKKPHVSVESFLLDLNRRFFTNRESSPSEQVANLRNAYRKIRQMAYVCLDSHYGPVPFSVDMLGILSDPTTLNASFTEDAPPIAPWAPLEIALRDSIYMARWSMYELGKATENERGRLSKVCRGSVKRSDLKRLLEPRPSGNSEAFRTVFNHQYGSSIDGHAFDTPDDSVLIHLPLKGPMRAGISAPINNVVEWEHSASVTRYGETVIRAVAEFDPQKTSLRMALFDECADFTAQSFRDRLRSITRVVEVLRQAGTNYVDSFLGQIPVDEMKADARASLDSMTLSGVLGHRSVNDILRWCLRPVFGEDARIAFKSKGAHVPLFFAKGTTQLSHRLNHYAGVAEYLDADDKHEVRFLADVAKQRKERSYVIGYAGKTLLYKAQGKGKEKLIAEIDGFMVFTKKDLVCAVICEAKDQKSGSTAAAKKQLREKVLANLSDAFTGTITGVDGDGAFLEITESCD